MARVAVFSGRAADAVREGCTVPGICCSAPFRAVGAVLVAPITICCVDQACVDFVVAYGCVGIERIFTDAVVVAVIAVRGCSDVYSVLPVVLDYLCRIVALGMAV